jgi:ABC-type spermidine/putrescine transport system permease subunit I
MAVLASRHRVLVPSLLIAVPVLFLAVFFILPTALLLSAGFTESDAVGVAGDWTLENFQQLLTRPLYYRAIIRSFVVGTAVGALAAGRVSARAARSATLLLAAAGGLAVLIAAIAG